MIINLPNQFDLTIPFFIYWSIVFFNMNVERLNIYKRLRDFKVPSTILDNIFSEEDDITIQNNIDWFYNGNYEDWLW